MELRLARQSPLKLNATCGRKKDPIPKPKAKKTNTKVMELLRMGLYRPPEDKSKSKSRRF